MSSKLLYTVHFRDLLKLFWAVHDDALSLTSDAILGVWRQNNSKHTNKIFSKVFAKLCAFPVE